MENNNLENNIEVIEENKFENKKKKAIFPLIYYFVVMYGLSSILQIILMAIAPLITGQDLFIPDTNEITPMNMDFILTWSQILVYTILLLGLVFLTKEYLIKYLHDFKKKWKKLSLEILIGFGIFFATNILCNLFLGLLGVEGDSANQEAIISMLHGKYAVIILIVIVAIGPITEEIIFRHSFFSLFKKNTNKWIKILVSGAIFGGIHFVSAIINYISMGEFSLILPEFLMGLSYVAMGVSLGYIYTRCEENLVPVILLHILNNLIAAIEIFLM